MHDFIRPAVRLIAVAALVSAAGAVGACAKARAETAPDGPPLQMPEPPERVLVPVEIPLVTEAPPEPPPPPVAVAPTPPARPPERRPAPPVAQPAPVPPPVADTRELRTVPSATAVTERSVRDMLVRAQRDLGRVNYTRLSADGRAQYEQSKRFSTQAEDALRARNLVFAATLADKAATLAAELAGR